MASIAGQARAFAVRMSVVGLCPCHGYERTLATYQNHQDAARTHSSPRVPGAPPSRRTASHWMVPAAARLGAARERTWVSLPAFAHSDQRTTPWPPAMLGAHQTTPTTARAHAQQEPLTSVRKTQQMPRACTGTGTRVLLPRSPPVFRSEWRGGLGSGRGRWRAP